VYGSVCGPHSQEVTQAYSFEHLVGTFHWIVPVLIIIPAIGAVAAGIATVVGEFQDASLTNFLAVRPKLEVGLDAGLASFSDLVATTALCWSFNSVQTGIKRTDTLLQKLFQYTVTRGLFVTINQTVFLILFLVKPEKLWWMPFHLSLSKVYVITMVAMLNSRQSLRNNSSASNGIITDSDIMPGHSTNNRSGTMFQNSDFESHTTSSNYNSGNKFIVAAIGGAEKAKTDDYIQMQDRAKGGIVITREELPSEDI